ncbi:MAG: prolipoprotein diacylglyceryl transferase [Clostridia bacterium]|nr:prolipoprotein diacylglyceryl transferase [Clostridia bacterium]
MNKWMKKALFAVMLAALALLIKSPALSYPTAHYGVVVAVAALAAVLLLRTLRAAEAKKRLDGANDGPIGVINKVDHLDLALAAVPAALVGARLAYCLSRFSFYFVEMGPLSVLRVWEGGCMLYGAALGALLAAALVAKLRGASVPATLDELAAPGMLAVMICRLGEWGTGEGVGAWIENEALMRLPFAVVNEYEEWQLAVFLFEAIAALVVLLALLRVKRAPGEKILSALLWYACCQVMLESMRMDSCLKIGFVRISQVISALVILGVTCLRAYRAGGRKLALMCGLPVLLCVAAVGGIEWALDKTPVSNILLYAVMVAVCVFLAFNGRAADNTKKEQHAA